MQSGTNCRHATLSEIKWSNISWIEHVVELEGEIGCVQVANVKNEQKPREYYVCDAISLHLFTAWYRYFAPQASGSRSQHVFFLPKVCPNMVLDFSQKFTYQNHKEACINCVEWLGLPISSTSKTTLGSNSVRKGNAATVGMAVKGAGECANIYIYIYTLMYPWWCFCDSPVVRNAC